MNSTILQRRGSCLTVLLCLLPGCGSSGPPAITEVEGVVLLDGRPVHSAQIELYPMQSGLDAEWISRGITDKDGKFRLTMGAEQKPGAAVGRHRVVVRDAPPPPESRDQSARGQEILMKYRSSLANRRIPDACTAVGTTKLEIEVKPDQKQYEIALPR